MYAILKHFLVVLLELSNNHINILSMYNIFYYEN